VIAVGATIDDADVQGLATLGNTKMAPALNYAFASFSDVVAPRKVTGTIAYGTGNRLADGVPVSVRVSSHDGSGWGTQFMGGTVTPDNSGRPYKITWSWTAVAGAAKYHVQAVEFGLSSESILGDQFLAVNKIFRIVAGTSFTDDVDFYALANDAWADVGGWQTEELGSLVGAVNTRSPLSRLRELQRMRDDMWTNVLHYAPGTEYFPDAYKLSTDQCVGINPCPAVAHNGKLFLTPFPVKNGGVPAQWDPGTLYLIGDKVAYAGSLWTATANSVNQVPAGGSAYWTASGVPSKDFLLFKNIRFLFSGGDEDFSNANIDYTADIPYLNATSDAADLLWGVMAPLKQVGVGSGSTPNVTVSETFGFKAPVDCQFFARIEIPLRLGGVDVKYILMDVAAGAHGTYNFTATGDYAVPPTSTARCEFFFPATTARAGTQIIHPANDGQKLTLTALADNNVLRGFSFTNTTVDWPADDKWPFVAINLTPMRGVWQADTLPIPAINTFLDTDIAPHVQKLAQLEFNTVPRRIVATALDETFLQGGANSGTVVNPRTAMRQPSPTLVRQEVTYGNVNPPLAKNAKYIATVNYPDDVTLAKYYGPGATAGDDPIVSVSAAISIYVSLKQTVDIADPTTYGFKTTNGQVNFADVQAFYDGSTVAKTAGGKKLFFVIVNDSGADIPVLAILWQQYTPVTIRPVEPGLMAQAAQWPVMRDTDAYPWFSGIDAYRSLSQRTVTLANTAQDNTAFFFNTGVKNFSYSVDVPTLTILVSNTGTPNPLDGSTFQILKAGGTLTWADLVAQYGAAALVTATLHLTVYNATGASHSTTISARFENYGNISAANYLWRFQQYPLVVPSIGVELDPTNQTQGPGECFSNDIFENTEAPIIPPAVQYEQLIPQRGFMITQILVRRLPKLTVKAAGRNPSIYLPPTADADLQELVVAIGFNVGAVHTSFETINPGVFTALTTVTIPHGALEARATVAWPVLHGVPIAYQATDAVRCEVVACFQPIFHNRQYSGAMIQYNSGEYINDLDYAGLAMVNFFRFPNYFEGDPGGFGGVASYTQFPLSAQPVNDFVALLNLL